MSVCSGGRWTVKNTKCISISATLLACVLVATSAMAQTNSNVSWNPPHLSDGQPDIQGAWTPSANSGSAGAAYDLELGTPVEEHEITGTGNNAAAAKNMQPKLPTVIEGGKIPYQPWALAIRQDNYRKNMNPTKLDDLDSHSRCLQEGEPRQLLTGRGFRILQPPGYVVIFENASTRIIPLDGRPHIPSSIKLWAGDSVGHWEGNTLVVDVTNISDSAWYDWGGNFHSSDLHLVERWTFVDAHTLTYEAMNYDPKVLTRPWKLRDEFVRNRNMSDDMVSGEDTCYEGEKDIDVMLFNNKQAAEKNQSK
jgi:hypothetical protein